MWPNALTTLNAISDTAGTAMVCVNERGVHLATTPNMDEIGRRFVDENWSERNSRGQLAFEKGLVGVSRFATGEELFAPGEQDMDPMTSELFRPYGFGFVAGFIVELPHGDTVIMNVEQYQTKGPIGGKSLDRLNALYPVLARAATLSARASIQHARTAVEALAAIGIPAAAVTPTGRVVLANEAFSEASHIWTTRGGDRIGLHDRVAAKMLIGALETLELARSPRSIPVRANAGGAVSAVVQVVPVRRAAHDIFGSTDAILILSEQKSQATDATLIQSLFDLTPAEIAVAQSVTAGLSVGDIAQSSGRSIETIRSQLKGAMAKTGSSRQLELALLMRQLGRPAGP
ncbi:MAG: helix-turn-helix transcriptional regulator [Rhodococcus sp.]|nr:helix-turn-helix transcriptional regulator [Rhodococcus sp. (in: high G+C Gram-positive bacteria)]